jgi:hypothetical protein
MKDHNEQLAYNIRKQTSMDTFAKIAKVSVVIPGGRYDVELGGGQTLNGLTTVTKNKYNVDDWVTLEFFGGDWVIAGMGSQKGGG